MKTIFFCFSMFICFVSFSQTKNCLATNSPKESKVALKEPTPVYDGTFYIITDNENPEIFLNTICSVAEEFREENKDVKVKISDRSMIVVFSKKKINKDNFEPAKSMIQFK